MNVSLVDPEIAQKFSDNGYAIARGVFNGELLAAMKSDFDRVVAQLMASGEEINARWSGAEKIGPADSVVVHTHNVQQYSAVWMRALLHESFLDCCRAILGPNVVLHHSKLFMKPPEKGSPFPMHQDWGYFPSEKDTMMAAVIHLSDATDQMGCLRVVPGSHKLGRMQESGGQVGDFASRFPLTDALPLEAAAGDVVFFHYLTVHGSMPNTSQKPRKTVLVQLHAGDDEVEAGNLHPQECLVLSGWNHRMTREKANRSLGQ